MANEAFPRFSYSTVAIKRKITGQGNRIGK